MLTCISGATINELFAKTLAESTAWARGEARRDGKVTVESPGPVVFELTDPRQRVLNWPGRGNSIPAAAAETLWVIGGRSDVAFLSTYLKRAVDFTEPNDSSQWRAGYGPRLRRYLSRVDQLAEVVTELRERPATRRALMTIHSPTEDHEFTTAVDWPCNIVLSFMVRNGRLDLLTLARSQDLLWGWGGVNVFEFTVIQELVAELTGLELGVYQHIANNLHYYVDFEKRFETMRAANYDVKPAPRTLSPALKLLDMEHLGYALNRFFGWEYALSTCAGEVSYDNLLTGYVMTNSNYGCLHDLVWSTLAYQAAKLGHPRASQTAMLQILDPSMLAGTKSAIGREFKINV